MAGAPLLSVADDIDSGAFLVVEREPCRVVVRFVERRARQAPSSGNAVPVRGKPVRFRHAADDRGGYRYGHPVSGL